MNIYKPQTTPWKWILCIFWFLLRDFVLYIVPVTNSAPVLIKLLSSDVICYPVTRLLDSICDLVTPSMLENEIQVNAYSAQ